MPDWRSRFFKMVEASGTTVEPDIPLAPETLQPCEEPENPRKFVARRLGELQIGWQRVEAALGLQERAVGDVKLRLAKGRLFNGHVNALAKLLKMEPKDLLDMNLRFNKWVAAREGDILPAKCSPSK
jgi:hypothetical protein